MADAEPVEDDWGTLIAGLRAGERRAERAFWERFGTGLHTLAAARLSSQLRQRVSPEDIVQSVCRTFLRRAREGEFVLEDAQHLWRLLCAIALTKAREQARFHGRQRRALGLDVALDGLTDAAELAAGEPAADEALGVAEAFEALLTGLDDEQRAMVVLKIQDKTNDEIAAQLGCSERTVRRLIERVRAQLTSALA